MHNNPFKIQNSPTYVLITKEIIDKKQPSFDSNRSNIDTDENNILNIFKFNSKIVYIALVFL
jgi:hypothetical protein